MSNSFHQVVAGRRYAGHASIIFLSLFLIANLLHPLRLAAADQNKDQFFIEFPKEANLDGLTVVSLVGGSKGGFIWSENITHSTYAIDVSGADRMNAIIFSPHFQTELITNPSLKKNPLRSTAVYLKPVAAVPFAGHIKFPAGVDPAKYTLQMRYYSGWGMGFLGYIDGSPPSFLAASANLNVDGSFTTTLPDLANDPVEGKHKEDGFFVILLREKATGNLPFELKREDGSKIFVDDFKVSERYPFVSLRAEKQ